MKYLIFFILLNSCIRVPNFKFDTNDCVSSGRNDSIKILDRTVTFLGSYYEVAYWFAPLKYNSSFPSTVSRKELESEYELTDCNE